MMAQVLCLLWSCLLNKQTCVTYDYSLMTHYSPIIQLQLLSICRINGKFDIKGGIMQSGLQREEIEFIMGLYNCNDTADKPVKPKKPVKKAANKKIDAAQYKSPSYLT